MDRRTIDHLPTDAVEDGDTFTVTLCGLSSTSTRPYGPGFQFSLIRDGCGCWHGAWKCLETGRVERDTFGPGAAFACLLDRRFLPD